MEEIVKINDRCVKCGACTYACRNHAIYDAGMQYEIDQSKCDTCGKCIDRCPVFAIKCCGLKSGAE